MEIRYTIQLRESLLTLEALHFKYVNKLDGEANECQQGFRWTCYDDMNMFIVNLSAYHNVVR